MRKIFGVKGLIKYVERFINHTRNNIVSRHNIIKHPRKQFIKFLRRAFDERILKMVEYTWKEILKF